MLFYLNKYTTKLEITEAIQKDEPIGQTTYTAEALVHSEMFFTEEHGSRKNKGVPQVLIVITDGESHDKDKLDTVSQRLRNKGITIYAVGVEGAKRNELLTMAGSEDKCFYVDTFEGLENLTANITNDICDISEPGKSILTIGCCVQLPLLLQLCLKESLAKASVRSIQITYSVLINVI